MSKGPQIFLYKPNGRVSSAEERTFSTCARHEIASEVCPSPPPPCPAASSSSQSRPGDYERCDMRARYYEGAVGRDYVYIRFEMRDTFN